MQRKHSLQQILTHNCSYVEIEQRKQGNYRSQNRVASQAINLVIDGIHSEVSRYHIVKLDCARDIQSLSETEVQGLQTVPFIFSPVTRILK